MKKSLSILSVLGAALLFVCCAGGDFTAEECAVTYTVSASNGTKAAIDGDGEAANVSRFICEVYSGGQLYKRLVNTVTKGTKQTSFDLKLMSSQDYEVLFWADSSKGESDLHYRTTGGLKAVTIMDETLGNDDALDAFFAKDNIVNLSAAYSRDIVLTRPFAQLNIITDDIDDLGDSELKGNIVPDKVTVTYSGPTAFNVSTGAVSAVKEMKYTAKVYYGISGKKSAPYYTLAMNYIFASPTKDVKEIGFTAFHGSDKLTSNTFSNIPIQRNYRTDIMGSLLTATSSWKVVIKPDWEDPDFDINKK